MYLLKLLRHQGMSCARLTVLTYSIIISRIIYASCIGWFSEYWTCW